MKRKNVFGALLLGLLTFALYVYKIETSLIFHSDFARDLYEIIKIAKGNLTWLGPKHSFGGLYAGPYYFYLFVPIFWLTNFSILSLPIFNAFLFSSALSYFAKKSIDKYSIWKGIVATLCLSIITLTVYTARSPGNANTYIPLLLLLLTYIHFERIDTRLKIIILGLMYGIILNFTLTAIILFLPLTIIIISKIKHKKEILFFLFAILLTFLPIAIFDITHNFVILQNTISQHSYASWFNNENIIKGEIGKKNLFDNFFFVSKEIQSVINISPILAFVTLIGLQLIDKKKKNKILLISAAGALLLLVTILRYQFALHYVYPTAFYIFFTIIYLLLETKFSILLPMLFALLLIAFPTRLYKESTVQYYEFERAVNYSIENKLVDSNSQFNLVYLAHPSAILGYEFRYFFQKNNLPAKSEFDYSSAQTLLIFSRRKNIDLTTLNTWEFEQFGREHLKTSKQYKVGNIDIYKVKK